MNFWSNPSVSKRKVIALVEKYILHLIQTEDYYVNVIIDRDPDYLARNYRECRGMYPRSSTNYTNPYPLL